MFGDSYFVKSIWIKMISFLSSILLVLISHMHLSALSLACRNKHLYHQKQGCFLVLQFLSHIDTDSTTGKDTGPCRLLLDPSFHKGKLGHIFQRVTVICSQRPFIFFSSWSISCLIYTMIYTMIYLLDTVPMSSPWTIFYPFLSSWP